MQRKTSETDDVDGTGRILSRNDGVEIRHFAAAAATRDATCETMGWHGDYTSVSQGQGTNSVMLCPRMATHLIFELPPGELALMLCSIYK